jgi:SPP1 family predicted phage head-tail adaptor
MTITAGKYNVFVHLQRRRDDQPNAGEGDLLPQYRTEGEAWVSIEPLNGRELWIAQQVRPEVSHRLKLRWHPTVAEGWRVLRPNDGRVFQVLARLGEYEEGETQLLCAEVRR